MVHRIKPVINNMVSVQNNGARNCKTQEKVINYKNHCTLKNEYPSDISIPKKIGELEMEQSNAELKQAYRKRGNPFKRGKTWTYIYYAVDPITLKKKQKTKGGYKTKKEAEEALRNIEAEITTGAYIDDKKLTLEKYLKQWIAIHKNNIAVNTLNGYLVNINNHIVPAIGQVQLCNLSKNDINNLFEILVQKNLSQTSIKYVRNVLRKALNDAEGDDLIRKNPCSYVPLPKPKSPKFTATRLDAEQSKILLQSAQGSGIELEILLTLMLGLRRGETLGLMFSDFDFNKSEVHIQRQLTAVKNNMEKDKKNNQANSNTEMWGLTPLKTIKSDRILSVPQAVINAVLNRKKLYFINKKRMGTAFNDTDLVCCNEDGSYRSPQTVYHAFQSVLKKAELPPIRFHDLRHSCATILLNEGVALTVISKMLGHTTIGTTANIYCDITKKKTQPAQTMESLFFAQNRQEEVL